MNKTTQRESDILGLLRAEGRAMPMVDIAQRLQMEKDAVRVALNRMYRDGHRVGRRKEWFEYSIGKNLGLGKYSNDAVKRQRYVWYEVNE